MLASIKVQETHGQMAFLIFRNCSVGRGYSIKISDHAMFCNNYETDYYVSDTKARLPIRWMAWESLLLVSFIYILLNITGFSCYGFLSHAEIVLYRISS
jgi:predicted membrane-bound dolichyl-phosphate-mannose-protein mannosyltransferase